MHMILHALLLSRYLQTTVCSCRTKAILSFLEKFAVIIISFSFLTKSSVVFVSALKEQQDIIIFNLTLSPTVKLSVAACPSGLTGQVRKSCHIFLQKEMFTRQERFRGILSP